MCRVGNTYRRHNVTLLGKQATFSRFLRQENPAPATPRGRGHSRTICTIDRPGRLTETCPVSCQLVAVTLLALAGPWAAPARAQGPDVAPAGDSPCRGDREAGSGAGSNRFLAGDGRGFGECPAGRAAAHYRRCRGESFHGVGQATDYLGGGGQQPRRLNFRGIDGPPRDLRLHRVFHNFGDGSRRRAVGRAAC